MTLLMLETVIETQLPDTAVGSLSTVMASPIEMNNFDLFSCESSRWVLI